MNSTTLQRATLALALIFWPLAGLAISPASASVTSLSCTVNLTGTQQSTYGGTNTYTGNATCTGGAANTEQMSIFIVLGGVMYALGIGALTETTPNSPAIAYTTNTSFTWTTANASGVPKAPNGNTMFTNSSQAPTTDIGCGAGVNCIASYSGGWSYSTALTIGTVFGTALPCNVTSQAGFYSATGDGSKSFDYTYTYTGPADTILAAPVDSTTATQTVHGKTFPADSTIVNSPPASTATVPSTPGIGGDPNATEYWCYSSISGWSDWGNAYSGGSGSGPSTLGCSMNSVTGNYKSETPRDDQYTFKFANSKQTALVLQWSINLNLTTAPNNYSTSNTINTKAFTYDFFNTTSANQTTVTMENNRSTGSWTTAPDAEIWCYRSDTSTWVDLGSLYAHLNIISNNNGSSSNGIVDCSHFPALPITWDVGTDLANVAQWGVCAAQWLFVPTSWSKVLPPGLNGKPPFLWVSDATAGITTMYNGITSSLASDKCAGPQVQPFHSFTAGIFATNSTIHNFTIALPSPASVGCTATSTNQNAGEIFGARAWIRAVELFGLTLAFIATIWRLLPWSHNSDADIIERFGGLNLDGDYIDTQQTNEGSD